MIALIANHLTDEIINSFSPRTQDVEKRGLSTGRVATYNLYHKVTARIRDAAHAGVEAHQCLVTLAFSSLRPV